MMTTYAMPKASAEMPPARHNHFPSALIIVFCKLFPLPGVHAQNQSGTGAENG